MQNKTKKSLLSRIMKSQISSVVIALILLLLAVSILNGRAFWKIGNIITIASNATVIGVLACGMTLVIIMGGIDLSIAANAAFAAMITGFFSTNLGWNPILALIIGLAVAAAFGAFNGTIIAYQGFNPMIATLSAQLIIRALCYIINNALSIEVSVGLFKAIGRTKVFGILPIYVLYFLVVIVVFAYVLANTGYGRKVLAVGGNEGATYLSGINVRRIKVITYMISGILAGIAGIINALSVSYATPQALTGREFEVISAVVLGGTSLSGGKGSMLGTFLGVMVMAIIGNVLILVGVQSYWQNFAQGVILLLAVYIDTLKNKNSGN